MKLTWPIEVDGDEGIYFKDKYMGPGKQKVI